MDDEGVEGAEGAEEDVDIQEGDTVFVQVGDDVYMVIAGPNGEIPPIPQP